MTGVQTCALPISLAMIIGTLFRDEEDERVRRGTDSLSMSV